MYPPSFRRWPTCDVTFLGLFLEGPSEERADRRYASVPKGERGEGRAKGQESSNSSGSTLTMHLIQINHYNIYNP